METTECVVSEEFIKNLQHNFFNPDESEENSLEVEILPKESIELNLLSTTNRLRITKKNSSDKPISVFVKKIIEKSAHGDVKSEKIKNCFVREAEVYRDFLRKVPNLLARVKDEAIISPQMFDFSSDRHVILEDLSVLGYKSQRKFLNLAQSEAVFVQMAKFHALSFFCHHEMGQDLRKFSNTICESFTPTLKLMKKGAQDFVEEIKAWDGFSSQSDAVEKFLPHYVAALCRETEPNPPGEGFNVLCHGDFHIGNILIHETTQNIVLIDFQFSAWRSPAYDFLTAFNTICCAKVNLIYRNHLIRIYHKKFKTLLEDLGFTQRIPTLLDVHLELLRHGFLELYIWTFYLPLLIRYDRDDEDLATKVKRSLQSFEYKMILSEFLPKFIEKGYLESS